MSINHVGIAAPPTKYEAVVAFYTSALGPLNYTAILSFPGGVGMGPADTKVPDFWIGQKDAASAQQESHVAFLAKDEAAVRAFHAAALSADAGGRDNGAPGIRAQYRPTYYAAFVLDPLGNNIEAFYDPVEHERKGA
ncbi:Glyoxalase family protein [Neofusicoccum parvum]|nr:Glyoxalase family protein [Neofusicoccum parvum]